MIRARDYFSTAPIMQAGQARAQQYQNNGQLFGDLIKALSQIATQSIQKKQTNDLISQNPLFTTQETVPEQQVRYGNAPQIPTQQPFSATGNRSVVGVTDSFPITSQATATFRTPTDRSGNHIQPMQPAPFANVATATIPAQTEQVLNRQGILNLLANPLTRQYALDSLGSTKLIEDMQPKREPFTLGEGQVRYDANGKPLAVGFPKSPTTKNSIEIPTGRNVKDPKTGAWGQEFTMGDPITGKPIAGAQKFVKYNAPNQTAGSEQSFENWRKSPDYNDVLKAVAFGGSKFSSVTSGRFSTMAQKQQFLADIRKINPNYKEYAYDNDKTFEQQYLPGKPIGNKIANLNTAIEHTGKLVNLVDKLGNDNAQFVNSAKNWIAQTFGTARAIPLNSFEAVKSALAGELGALFKGGNAAATDPEIDNISKVISSAQNPEALKSALVQYLAVGKDRIDQFSEPYNNRFGTDKDFLNENPRKILQQMGILVGSNNTGTTIWDTP